MNYSTKEKASDSVSRISKEIPVDGITFKDFLELIGDQGGMLSCIVLVAPFLFPVSIPGSSIPFGLAILLINIGILLERHPLIPKSIMEYKISQNNMLKILNGMGTILSKFERLTKPRLTVLSGKDNMVYVNSSVMSFCAFLLMLPVPVPLTDFLPAYSMLFLALGTIERDGYLIIAGYSLAVVTTIYFLLIAILGLAGIKLILSYFGINF